jgi:UrcA family protein
MILTTAQNGREFAMQRMALGYALAVCISAAMIAAPSFAAAKYGASAEPAIVAIGRHGALVNPGPQTNYAVSVNVADLDIATASGRSAAAARVKRAALSLCEASAEGPSFAGFYNRDQRDCWQSAQDQAKDQMAGQTRVAVNP